MMNGARCWWAATVLGSAAAFGTPDAAPHDPSPAAAVEPPVAFAWHHEQAKFSYLGLTTRYSCDGLEGQVRRILAYLGARPGMKVTATGCPLASSAPGAHAWVDAQFDVPEAVAPTDPNAVPGALAQWRRVTLTPRRPNFLTAGDCELVDAMRDLLSQSVHLREFKSRTTCMPGSLSIDGFEVSGQALVVIDPKTTDKRP